MLGNLDTGAQRMVFTDSDAAWIDMQYGDPRWTENGQFFSWLSERDGWRHLYLVSRSGDEVRLITAGEYDVTDVVHVDAGGGWAYFMASPKDPTGRYLYRTTLDAKGALERLTPSGPAGSHSYKVSEDGRWAIHTHSSRDQVPRTELVSLPDHAVQRVLVDNAKIRSGFDAVDKAPVEFFRVAVADGIEVDGWMIKPPDFDPGKSYPLLVYVYGEPVGQTVQNQWHRARGMWHFYLAQQGYLIASLDHRGSLAPRGSEWRKSVYRKIGILPSADQAAGVQAMLERFSFIDRERVGAWGWSGGGSTTLNLLFRYPEIFSMGIAVAPVPDQMLYDSIYQERYMGLPDDNADGYKNGSPITHAHNLEGNLLLIHGTGDDNVHFQGTERLINELIKHGKPFEMMSYPNRSHSINEGDGTSLHLHRTMTRFLDKHLEAGPKPMTAPKQPEATSFLGEPLYSPTPFGGRGRQVRGSQEDLGGLTRLMSRPSSGTAVAPPTSAATGTPSESTPTASSSIPRTPASTATAATVSSRPGSSRRPSPTSNTPPRSSKAPTTRSSPTVSQTLSASRSRPSTPTSGITSASPTTSPADYERAEQAYEAEGGVCRQQRHAGVDRSLALHDFCADWTATRRPAPSSNPSPPTWRSSRTRPTTGCACSTRASWTKGISLVKKAHRRPTPPSPTASPTGTWPRATPNGAPSCSRRSSRGMGGRPSVTSRPKPTWRACGIRNSEFGIRN